MMKTARINISLPQDVVAQLDVAVPARQRSRFVRDAVIRLLIEKQDEELAKDYRQAASEIRRINQDLEGALVDGLDEAR